MNLTSVLGLLAFVSLPAFAADPPPDSLTVGPAHFKPSVTVGVEAWSNPFLKVGEKATGKPGDKEVPAYDFVLTPALGIDVATDKVKFTFDGHYTLRKYFGPVVAPKLDQFSNYDVRTRLDVFPSGIVGFHITEYSQMYNRGLNREFFKTALLRQFRNELGGGLDFHFGPGITLSPDFTWAYHSFKVPGDATFGDNKAYNRRNTLRPGLGLEWRFFPDTAFIFDFHAELNRWRDNFVATNAPAIGNQPLGQYLAKPDSEFYRTRAGLRGRITRIFLLKFTAGYGVGKYGTGSVTKAATAMGYSGNEADGSAIGFSKNVSGVDGLLIEAEGVFDLGYREHKRLGQEVTLQYQKDFIDSYFTNYVAFNKLMAGLDSRWGRFFGTHVDGGIRFEGYHGEISRQDKFIFVNGSFTVYPTAWFNISANIAWNERASTDKAVEYDNVIGSLLFKFGF